MANDGNSCTLKRSSKSDLQELIRLRAEEIYVRNGRLPGRDLENWAQAEQIRQELQSRSAPRRGIVINVKGVQYVGEYYPVAANNYAPGEFSAGLAVSVRFEADRMFVTRPNGMQLETTVVKKIG